MNSKRNVTYKSFLSTDFLAIAISKLLPSFFLLIITILFARNLSKSAYGNFQTFWLYYNLLAVFLNFGVSSSILSNDLNSTLFFFKKYKAQIIFSYLAFSLVVLLSAFSIIPNVNMEVKGVLFFCVFIQVLGSVLDALLIKISKIRVYTITSILYSVIFFIVHLFFYYNEFNLLKLVYCIAIMSLLKLCLFFFVKLPKVENKTTLNTNFFPNWLFVGITAILGIVAMWLDKIFIQHTMPPEQYAIFFNGALELPFFAVLIGAMETVLLRNISANLQNQIFVVKNFKQSIKILSSIAIPVFFCFLVIYKEVFAIVFNNNYNASTSIFFIYIFLIPLRVTHYGVILQSYGKAYLISVGALLDIIFSLCLMFLLYPKFGTVGVAFSLVISTYLQALFYIWHSARVLEIKIFNLIPIKDLLKKVALNATLFFLVYLGKNNFSYKGLIILSITVTTVVIGYYAFTIYADTKTKNNILL
jgi:O-antigen/teichoic acid export membrane protein